MHETSRPRPVVTILFAIAVLACGETTPPVGGPTPFDGMTPVVYGTIVSRAPVDGRPGMNVFEEGVTAEERYCSPRVRWFFGPDVLVFRNGGRNYISDLQTGQRVSVFGVLSRLKSCSPAGMAEGILID